MRRVSVAVVLAATVTAMTVAGCDGPGSVADPGPGLVVRGTPPATPYPGPLRLPAEKARDGSSQTPRAVSGAAGRALECDGDVFDGSGSEDGWSASEGGATPEEGLALYFDMAKPELPAYGYRVERRERGRVLYSFDVGGRTKVAVVVAEDQPNRPGWGPETSASCDPAELPQSFTATTEWEIWTGRDGRRVPVTRLSSSPGPDHCGWASARFLDLGGRIYARDPEGVLARDGLLAAPYRGRLRALPAEAYDTGYRYRDQRLWLTPGRATAYVRTPRGVEAWPRLKAGVNCQ
ncbi:hypothetical protein [Streptomyces sp. NPDC048106]|uniref:hypothetical protein n=1 Tax=Streptomyces sp. NPDC048106 TaxID=3155750 RepID=UPI00345183FD